MSILQMTEDTTGGAAGSLPNLMHMLDATLVHIMNIMREEEGLLTSADIHDSFGSPIDKIVWTSDAAATAFKVTHRLFDLNKFLKHHGRAQIHMGNLNIEEIKKVIF